MNAILFDESEIETKSKENEKEKRKPSKIAALINAASLGLTLHSGKYYLDSLTSGKIPELKNPASYALIPNAWKFLKSLGKGAAEVATNASEEFTELPQTQNTQAPESKKEKLKRLAKKAGIGAIKAIRLGVSGLRTAQLFAMLTGINPFYHGSEEDIDMEYVDINFNIDEVAKAYDGVDPSTLSDVDYENYAFLNDRNKSFIKMFGRNLLPGMLVAMVVGSKLIESKILAVNSTADGRLNLQLLPQTGQPGAMLAMTDPITSNTVVDVVNPYGKGMKTNQSPQQRYYSMENDVKDSDVTSFGEDVLGLFSEYMDNGYSKQSAMASVMSDLGYANASEADKADALNIMANFSRFISPLEYKNKMMEDENYRKWGVRSSQPLYFGDLGAKRFVSGKWHQFWDGDNWMDKKVEKQRKKDIGNLLSTVNSWVDKKKFESEGSRQKILDKLLKMPLEKRKECVKTLSIKFPDEELYPEKYENQLTQSEGSGGRHD